ncbi:MAG TPA: ribonuclease HII [Methylomirabilota bacterium]|nr:ribonuclease HII [Methylomirabilota bacterium]
MKRARWRRLAREEARWTGERAAVAGVDEAGRGPLAGPVVAAAVILDLSKDWDGIDDSKQLTAEQREDLYARVMEGARAFAWSAAGPRVIDRMNIRRATHRAMASAVRRLAVAPELVLVDGHETIGDIAHEQCAVVGGDGKCLSIAAASIVAKVIRDRLMERLDKVWPVYGFARHKGYGTAEHLNAIRMHGPCPLHRWSFAPVTELELPLV